MSTTTTTKPRLTRATHPCPLVRAWRCDGCFDCRDGRLDWLAEARAKNGWDSLGNTVPLDSRHQPS